MNGRELYMAIHAGEPVDRLPVQGVGPWAETLVRWHAEGLGRDEDVNRALGLVGDDAIGLPLNLNMVPTFPIQVLEMDDAYVTVIDEFGVTKKALRRDFELTEGKKSNAGLASAMSHWIDFPVKDLRSWKVIYEERFGSQLKGRLPDDWNQRKVEFVHRSQERWVAFYCFPFFGLFGPMRELMGLEGLIYAMADSPALIHTVVDDLTDFWLAVFDQVLGDVRLDQIMFFEDMCATKAPLISPALFREFMAPGYRKVIGGLREMGVRHFAVDTDGNAWRLIPDLMACGINGLHPCEAQAEMDVGALRTAFPDLSLNGGIDKRTLALGPAAIEAELERCFTVAWRSGRYTPSLDHLAPPDISWSNAQYYAQRYLRWCCEPNDVRGG
ncbi:MAG: uroporphyrinogen decarboxylase family protein [Anaerolineae bacterium]